MTLRAIAEKWHFSEQRIQQHSSSALLKFGIPKDMHSAHKDRVVQDEICPALSEWIANHTEKLRLLTEPLEPEKEELEPESLPTGIQTFNPPEDKEVDGKEEEPEVVEGEAVDVEGRSRRPVPPLLLVVSVVICVALLAGAGILWRAFAPTPTQPSITPSFSSLLVTESTSTTMPLSTPQLPASPTLSPTPEFTFTPNNPPTAVPLPIREDFSKQYSKLWWVMGDPVITESVPYQYYSGVLTTRPSETATLLIGNTAWTDYFVSLRAAGGGSRSHILVGVRAIDLNNMVALDCDIGQQCTWIIIYHGERDTLPTQKTMFMRDNFVLTVEGDTFTAVGKFPDSTETRMSVVLPPKYQNLFTGGGVLIQITDGIGVDFVEINPLP